LDGITHPATRCRRGTAENSCCQPEFSGFADCAKQVPDQTVINSLNNQIGNLTSGLANARTTAEGIGAALFANTSKDGLKAIKKDLDKLHKDQLAKLNKISNATGFF
jgi:hypothetical protein